MPAAASKRRLMDALPLTHALALSFRSRKLQLMPFVERNPRLAPPVEAAHGPAGSISPREWIASETAAGGRSFLFRSAPTDGGIGDSVPRFRYLRARQLHQHRPADQG